MSKKIDDTLIEEIPENNEEMPENNDEETLWNEVEYDTETGTARDTYEESMDTDPNDLPHATLGRGLSRDVLELIQSETMPYKTKKALIFGAIFAMAEFFTNYNQKLQEAIHRYLRKPQSVFTYVVITLDTVCKREEDKRRVDELVSQLEVEDLKLTFNVQEQGDILLGRIYETQYQRALWRIRGKK